MTSPSAQASAPIVFSAGARELFARFSHDRNPLHIDPDYARRTPFGRCVLHGMLGVAASLGEAARERPIWLKGLRMWFRAPLYEAVRYRVRVDRSRPGVAVVALSGGDSLTPKLRVDLEYEVCPPHRHPASVPAWNPVRQAQAPDLKALQQSRIHGEYRADLACLDRLFETLGLPIRNLSPLQLQCLACMSYVCGMLVPGRQSLIAEADIRFDQPAGGTDGPLRYDFLVCRYDAAYGRAVISGELGIGDQALARMAITAFRRPEAIEFDPLAARQIVGTSADLAGKVALVTGGSRGLGAHIVTALALHGCAVGLNYRTGRREAEAIKRALAGARGEVFLLPADVVREEDCARMEQTLRNRYGRLDFLVNNASPPIEPLEFLELSPEGLVKFVEQTLRAASTPTYHLLPLLNDAGGCVIMISSQYATKAPPRFVHYAAAKRAVEGMTCALANEFRGVRYLIVRPPRLLTDQTNSGVMVGAGALMNPSVVAKGLVDRLREAPGGRPPPHDVEVIEVGAPNLGVR